MPFMRYRTGGRVVRRDGCRHCEILDAYESARTAWLERRESGASAGPDVAGGAHADIACYQLTDDEYRRLFPPPLFGDFLRQMSRTNDAEPEEWPEDDDSDIRYDTF